LVSPTTAYLLLTLTMALWGGALVVARGVHELAPPFALTFWRWLLALVIVLPVVWHKLPELAASRRLRWASLLPLSGFMVLGTTLSVTAVNYTTAINATIINAAQAAMTATVAFVVLHERLVARQMLGIACAFAGILVMVFRGDPSLLLRVEVNWGDFLMLGAIVAWACYAVSLHKAQQLPSGDVLLFVMSATGVVCLLPLYVVEALWLREFHVSPRAIGAIAYLGVASTVLAVYLWSVAIRSVGASRAGVFVNLIPVFGAVFAMVFLGERLYAFHVTGALLVFVGIAMAVRRRNP
jgi:drug/metabolite transporter (DMT)-like permease